MANIDTSYWDNAKKETAKKAVSFLFILAPNGDFIIENSKEFNEFLIKNNLGVEYKFIPDRDHSWYTWAQEIFEVIEYLKNKIKKLQIFAKSVQIVIIH